MSSGPNVFCSQVQVCHPPENASSEGAAEVGMAIIERAML